MKSTIKLRKFNVREGRKSMNKKKVYIVVMLLLFLILLTGIFTFVFFGLNKEEHVEANDGINTEYFSAYTDREEFKDIPALNVEYGKIGQVEEQGGGCYVLTVDGVTVDDYKEYLLQYS